MNQYLSVKLKIISFYLMVMVVYIHSSNISVKLSDHKYIAIEGYSSFIQNFISEGLTRISVPLFFIISGYLFFLNFNCSLVELKIKFSKRVSTLFIPYLLWSLYGILFFFILQSIPFTKPFFTNQPIKEYSIHKLLITLFINPIPYQLWFLRDLIIFVIISPIIFYLLKYLHFWFIIVLCFLWILELKFIIFSTEGLLFYVAGSFLTRNQSIVLKINNNNYSIILFFIWVVLVFIKTTLLFTEANNTQLLSIFHNICVIIGVLAFWTLYDVLAKNRDLRKTTIYNIASFSFFIYVTHEPIMTVFKKAAFYIIGTGQLSSLLIFLIIPILTIFLSLCIGSIIQKLLPKFFVYLTGGR